MLVSPLWDSTPPNFSKAPLATGILVAMVAVNVLGLMSVLEESGAAKWIVELLLGGGIENPWLALLLIYNVTSLSTEVITNNAAAVLLFPIATTEKTARVQSMAIYSKAGLAGRSELSAFFLEDLLPAAS
jgi:hypothetical protein